MVFLLVAELVHYGIGFDSQGQWHTGIVIVCLVSPTTLDNIVISVCSELSIL